MDAADFSTSIYIYGYEHEAIQTPISENNEIGAPLVPQKLSAERKEDRSASCT